MNLAATRKRLVLPGRSLEHNHYVLWIVPRRGETGHKVPQELLLHLDAAPCGQVDLDEGKIICSTALNVRVEAIKAKVFVRQFKHAMPDD